MATYLKGKSRPIRRQEGDTADITITFPAILPTAGATLKFHVYKEFVGEPIITKELPMLGQSVTVPLAPGDTKGKAGRHMYEIELTLPDGAVITTATNEFIIEKELIK